MEGYCLTEPVFYSVASGVIGAMLMIPALVSLPRRFGVLPMEPPTYECNGEIPKEVGPRWIIASSLQRFFVPARDSNVDNKPADIRIGETLGINDLVHAL